MKNLRKYALYIAIAATVFACKKEHLQQGTTTNGAPVFSFTGLVNGMPVSLQSGINNYYMYSSYKQDANNVYNFTGALQPIGCNGCANTIKITINDYKTTPIGAPATIDSSLVPGYYPYTGVLGGASSTYKVTFTPHSLDTTIAYNWNFGDGNTASAYMPTHIYYHPGNYNIILTVPNICNSSISNPINIGTPKASLIPKIAVTKDSADDSIHLSANGTTGGVGPYTYLWNLGDGSTSTSATPIHYLSNPGTYQITLTATDKNGLQSYTTIDTARFGDSAKCSIGFSSNVTPNANPKAFSNINIAYADASGNVYTSANAKQSSSSFFQVLSVSNYQNNENNQTTKQLHIQFSCKLVDSHSDTIQITNGQAVIAIAYK